MSYPLGQYDIVRQYIMYLKADLSMWFICFQLVDLMVIENVSSALFTFLMGDLS
jgi:hypothetical protein